MQTWIIDHSGPIDDVRAHVEELSYNKFLTDAHDQVRRCEARRLLLPDNEKAKLDVELQGHRDRVAMYDAEDRDSFERARATVLAELKICRTTHAGVCARRMPNTLESPRGTTLSISVSEYDGAPR